MAAKSLKEVLVQHCICEPPLEVLELCQTVWNAAQAALVEEKVSAPNKQSAPCTHEWKFYSSGAGCTIYQCAKCGEFTDDW